QLDVDRGRRANDQQVGFARRDVFNAPKGRAPENLRAFAVDREDLPLVAETHKVVKEQESPLPRMRGNAGDRHSPWIEERTKALDGVHRAALRSISASTATGRLPATIIGLTSIEAISGWSRPIAPSATSARASASRSISGSPRYAPRRG